MYDVLHVITELHPPTLCPPTHFYPHFDMEH